MKTTFEELRQAANDSGEDFDMWLEECNASMDPTALTNMPEIKQMLNGDKKEIKKLEDYNFERIIRKKLSAGEELADKEYDFILKNKKYKIKTIEKNEGKYAFGAGYQLVSEVKISETTIHINYFEDLNNHIQRILGYKIVK